MIRRRWGDPDRDAAIASYRRLAAGYDATCTNIETIRRLAIASLALEPGDVVMDVACGTGACLPLLAEAVGASGLVIGVEQSPEMAAIASRRAAALGPNVRVLNEAVQEIPELPAVDAFLFCYTHDVLQSPQAVARLCEAAKPRARFAVAGARILPWWWGFPVNLVTLYRARRYLTTFRGLRDPCSHLRASAATFQRVGTFHLGSSYLARGTFPSGAARMTRS